VPRLLDSILNYGWAVVWILGATISLSVGSINFDTGSSSRSVSFGNPISFACFKKNISNIKDLTIASETDSKIEIFSAGVTSIIEFKNENSIVLSYSIKTTTEKSKDSGVHKVIEAALKVSCSE
jgi:hypothetical protein